MTCTTASGDFKGIRVGANKKGPLLLPPVSWPRWPCPQPQTCPSFNPSSNPVRAAHLSFLGHCNSMIRPAGYIDNMLLRQRLDPLWLAVPDLAPLHTPAFICTVAHGAPDLPRVPRCPAFLVCKSQLLPPAWICGYKSLTEST